MKERKKRKRKKDRKKERNKVRKKERRNSMKKDKEIKKERKKERQKKTESFDLFTCDSPICSISCAYTNRLIYALLIASIHLFLAAYLAESSKTYRKDILEQRISRRVHALLQSGPDPSWSPRALIRIHTKTNWICDANSQAVLEVWFSELP